MTEPMSVEVASLLTAARERYLALAFVEARELNLRASQLARCAGDVVGLVRSLRFAGVASYRLERLEDSIHELTAARDVATEHELVCERLFIENHLGASLRRSGRISEAHGLLSDAVEEATRESLPEPRARLLGNLGALYDELMETERAADCYARYEELVGFLELEGRRPNALGLAGRAARQRGEFRAARRRFEEEERLGRERAQPNYVLDAACHLADLARAEGDAERAEKAVRDGQDTLAVTVDVARARRFWRGATEVALDSGSIVVAADRLRELVALGSGTRRDALDTADLQSRFFARAGMFGLAFEHAMQAARLADGLYSELRSRSPERLGSRLVQARRTPVEWASRVLAESAHTSAQTSAVEALIRRLGDAEALDIPPHPDGLVGPDGLHERANAIWRALVPERWDDLHARSRKDLVASQVQADSMTVDLSRSAHLMAVVVERELERRVVSRARVALGGDTAALRKWIGSGRSTLGSSQKLVENVVAVVDGRPCKLPGTEGIWRAFAPFREPLRAVLLLGVPLPRPFVGMSFIDVRNDVAHGSGAVELDRLAVDCVKEFLVLSEHRPLAGLLDVPVEAG